MKRIALLLLTVLLSFATAGSVYAASQSGEKIRWSQIKTGVYDPLHPHTLNWSGDVLDKGGWSLSTLKAASGKTADIVINQYGAMGANGIIKLEGEKLQDDTDSSLTGYTNSVTLEKGVTYLILLHEGKKAKIRIDQLTAAKAMFSYVLEEAKVAAPAASPSQTPQNETKQPAQPSAETNNRGATPPSNTGSASQNTAGKTWSDTYEVPGAANDGPFSIYLTVNSKFAMIYEKNGKRTDYELHTAPFLMDGNTMVPVRFISEALGAKVAWREEDQSIAIVSEAAVITLQLNNKQAKVNSQTYELEIPPVKNGDSTVIPLRFVSEHMNMFVYFDKGSILITDKERPNGYVSWLSEDVLAPPPGKQDEQKQEAASESSSNGLIGKWDLWVPGGFAQIGTTENGDGTKTVTSSYVAGASGGWVEVKSDGTYEWLDLGKTYKGTWSGTGSPILLKNGPMDSDWYMRAESDGGAKIYAWGLEYKASRAGN